MTGGTRGGGASAHEVRAMRRALDLARRGPVTGPNPRVGCVLLDADGAPLAEGHHAGAGTPHAEVAALADLAARAGGSAAGLTAVVTLEPCRHTGRSGPCTDALTRAGVTRVVVGSPDPNPRAAGGAEVLRGRGVDVVVGVLEEEARALNERWAAAVARGRPWVTWKVATTLDGRSAAADGTSRWITSAAARADVHRLRAEHDAVLVGTGTALADDPSLTVRRDGRVDGPQPLRVVVGAREVPAGARLRDGDAPLLHLRTHDPVRALEALGAREVRTVLLEGGPRLAAAFWRAGVVDEVVAYLAPALLGAGPAAVGDLGVTSMPGIARLRVHDVARVGDDVRLVARPAVPTRPTRPTGPTDPSHPSAPRRSAVFTGIVEEVGEVVAVEAGDDSARLTLRGPLVTSDAVHGASIAVDGVCLTVVEQPTPDTFTVDVMRETLVRSSLRDAAPGRLVNLERAMAAGGRFGGHVVQGHVDGTGTVTARTPGERWEVVRVGIAPELARYVVEKGSVTVDGTSLTVSAVSAVDDPAPWFEVSLIPTTLEATTLGAKPAGSVVNLEVDVLAKYVERMSLAGPRPPADLAQAVEAAL
ncbi:bifunctional diaminohydroxyphosphoribosylaminopyrimidine deaminase/5-amino-6-(5-phosphoribosylamino)uracil reductase RibD [Kineococcus sp. SYSU DK004]|uniref:bifunctional diaminohydroxyphosphoribosylaminopyrimidine deaminase/5-amino-6-(5-phosphoribosylamino)uracil reductase RibD n=1 Tax=Kineococcus sp. SYSU DK004 TaxID=3383125 RepID=UPI003D7DA17E